MPLYEYRCDACGMTTQSTVRGDRHHCENCGATATRRFSFRLAATFQDHYNHSVGSYVSNDRDFRDKLKRAGEEQTLRTGIEHNYEPIDYADRDACGITDSDVERMAEEKARVRESA